MPASDNTSDWLLAADLGAFFELNKGKEELEGMEPKEIILKLKELDQMAELLELMRPRNQQAVEDWIRRTCHPTCPSYPTVRGVGLTVGVLFCATRYHPDNYKGEYSREEDEMLLRPSAPLVLSLQCAPRR